MQWEAHTWIAMQGPSLPYIFKSGFLIIWMLALPFLMGQRSEPRRNQRKQQSQSTGKWRAFLRHFVRKCPHAMRKSFHPGIRSGTQ